MSREISVLVEDHVWAQLTRRAKEYPHGTKGEHVAADWIRDRARENGDMARKFRDAARKVDRMLSSAEVNTDG